MIRLDLHVDTLACEADEVTVVDGLLAQDGVVDATLDFDSETLRLAFDERVTDEASVHATLRFYGIHAS